MRVKVLVIIGILIVGLALNQSVRADLDLDQDPLEISSISHVPLTPVVNSTVNFSVVLSGAPTIDFTNVSLVLDIQGTRTSVLMKPDGSNFYNTEVKMNETGKVTYHAELYVSQSLSDTSIEKSFYVIGDPMDFVPVDLEFGQGMGLSFGNFTITTPNNTVNISITVQKPLTLTIFEDDVENFPSVTDTVALSQKYRIEVNDTTAFEEAELSLKYNESLVWDLDINPELLQMYSRESEEDQWGVVDSTINTDQHIIVSTTNSFSEWVVAASTPKLRFLNQLENKTWELNENMQIHAKIKNFGALPAENVTIRIILPSSILLDNISSFVTYPSISPLSNISVTWNVMFQMVGEYNLVVVAESPNSDDDLVQFKVEIGEQTSSVSSFSDESSFLIPVSGITVMSFILLAKRKKML